MIFLVFLLSDFLCTFPRCMACGRDTLVAFFFLLCVNTDSSIESYENARRLSEAGIRRTSGIKKHFPRSTFFSHFLHAPAHAFALWLLMYSSCHESADRQHSIKGCVTLQNNASSHLLRSAKCSRARLLVCPC